MSTLEDRLREALHDGAPRVDESPDLFARVELSIDDDRRLRHQHRALVAVARVHRRRIAARRRRPSTDTDKESLLMDWWILELITIGVLVAIAFWLGPLIKRFGRSYAADVFRANPRTGKSFIMLTDVAYYLIFFSYILFTVSFEPKGRGTTRSTPRSSSTRRRASAASC